MEKKITLQDVLNLTPKHVKIMVFDEFGSIEEKDWSKYRTSYVENIGATLDDYDKPERGYLSICIATPKVTPMSLSTPTMIQAMYQFLYYIFYTRVFFLSSLWRFFLLSSPILSYSDTQ